MICLLPMQQVFHNNDLEEWEGDGRSASGTIPVATTNPGQLFCRVVCLVACVVPRHKLVGLHFLLSQVATLLLFFRARVYATALGSLHRGIPGLVCRQSSPVSVPAWEFTISALCIRFKKHLLLQGLGFVYRTRTARCIHGVAKKHTENAY